jgi:hypothetical protein
MTIEQFDFVNVEEKAKALGCRIPTGIALLPNNFEAAHSKEELLHAPTVTSIRILFRCNGITETPLELEGETYPVAPRKFMLGWIGPIIFANRASLDHNPFELSKALDIVAFGATEFFRGYQGEGGVKLDVVVEKKNKSYKRIHYEGPPYGIREYAKVVRRVRASD